MSSPLRKNSRVPNSLKPVTKTTRVTKPRKKPVGKSSKSPSKTLLSVIVKNLSLVVVMLVLIQMIRRLVVNQESGFEFVLNPNSVYERRIADVEELVISMKNSVQLQVEVVERKVASEVSRLKSELGKRIGEVGYKFDEFNDRIESVERLSKEEFDRFGEFKFDEIRKIVRENVENEIGKHVADGIGRVDYAVASGGGMVLKHSEGFKGGRWFSTSVRNDAVKMLQPSFGQPGECFALKGDTGFVEIKVRSAIVPEAITLEHVSKSVAFDRSTAPKDCKVWGWLVNDANTQKEHLLTEFTYDLEKSSSQTFNVSFNTEGVNPIIIDTIRLQFMSNHGSSTHTCIYRVRVHGHQPDVS